MSAENIPEGFVSELTTVNGITEVAGNYPSKHSTGERAAWFRDSEGNLLGVGQPLVVVLVPFADGVVDRNLEFVHDPVRQ